MNSTSSRIPTVLALWLAVFLLSACVSSIDADLPYADLPTITVGAEVALVASPTHPTAYLPADPIPAGAVAQVMGANEDNSWLLVLRGDTLGWMPTFFSRTNVSTVNAALILTTLDGNCTKFQVWLALWAAPGQ